MHRPLLHYAPRRNWMNDPNGLIRFDGRYHLYYQYNPHGTSWGHMSWGHAVGTNLLDWDELPVAIPEVAHEQRAIFSGTAVLDRENRSGLGRGERPPLVAVFTGHRTGGGRTLQTVDIAVSHDGGSSFEQYAGNPVIDVGERKFGDPKVFRHEPSGAWVLLAISGHDQGTLRLFRSADLVHWEESDRIDVPGPPAGVWECPDLVLVPGAGHLRGAAARWIVKLNYVSRASEDASLRHHTAYFAADFDGRRLCGLLPVDDPGCDGHQTASADLAPDDAYAELCWTSADEPDARAVQTAWVVQKPHPDRPWTGVQSLPRELCVAPAPGPDGRAQLHCRPAAEVSARFERPDVRTVSVDGDVDLGAGEAHLVRFRPRAGGRVRCGFEDGTEFDIECRGDHLVINPRELVLRPHESCANEAALLFVDGSIVELFWGGRTLAVDLETVAPARRLSASDRVELASLRVNAV